MKQFFSTLEQKNKYFIYSDDLLIAHLKHNLIKSISLIERILSGKDFKFKC